MATVADFINWHKRNVQGTKQGKVSIQLGIFTMPERGVFLDITDDDGRTITVNFTAERFKRFQSEVNGVAFRLEKEANHE